MLRIIGSPDIDWEYTITIGYGPSRMTYVVEGCHDGFPSHELYIHGRPIVNDQAEF